MTLFYPQSIYTVYSTRILEGLHVHTPHNTIREYSAESERGINCSLRELEDPLGKSNDIR